jgi:hypothetical protein
LPPLRWAPSAERKRPPPTSCPPRPWCDCRFPSNRSRAREVVSFLLSGWQECPTLVTSVFNANPLEMMTRESRLGCEACVGGRRCISGFFCARRAQTHAAMSFSSAEFSLFASQQPVRPRTTPPSHSTPVVNGDSDKFTVVGGQQSARTPSF